MDLLKVIEIKNKFHILLLKAKEKAKTKGQQENLNTLTETLFLLNSFMQHFEDLGKQVRETKLDNARKHLDNELLRSEVRYLKNQIEDLKNRIKTRILIAYFITIIISFIAVLITGILIGKEMYQ